MFHSKSFWGNKAAVRLLMWNNLCEHRPLCRQTRQHVTGYSVAKISIRVWGDCTVWTPDRSFFSPVSVWYRTWTTPSSSSSSSISSSDVFYVFITEAFCLWTSFCVSYVVLVSTDGWLLLLRLHQVNVSLVVTHLRQSARDVGLHKHLVDEEGHFQVRGGQTESSERQGYHSNCVITSSSTRSWSDRCSDVRSAAITITWRTNQRHTFLSVCFCLRLFYLFVFLFQIFWMN